MLFNPLDQILGTRSKVRLLRALVLLDRPVSGREAARLARLSRQAIGVLDDLVSTGIVNRQETAGQHLYTFARANCLAPAILRLFDEERERTEALFQRVASVIDESRSVLSAVFFGSAARGEAKVGSDLDLLAIVAHAGARRRVYDDLSDASVALRSEFGVELSPVVIEADRIRRQHAEGDLFITEVLRDGRRIYGQPIEELVGG